MRIVCIGGGPAGLYFGLLMKLSHPEHSVTVVERNRPYDTFGWGVVFSDAMMQAMRAADPVSAAEIADAFNHWDDIELIFKGKRQRTTGHGFIGIGRKHLLNILQRRCEQIGIELVFERDVDSDLDFPDADLIIASDGINSKIRERYAAEFKPDLVVRPNRFIWLGTHKPFDAFTFDFRRTEHGWFQAHIYKFDRETSTFIVETTEEAYAAHRLGELDQQGSIDFCEKLFAETLDGAKLMTNARHLRGSAWLNFNRLICGKWSRFNGRSHVVLMGDAAHTAHFAIGSGTKLALDDAIELTKQFDRIGHGRETIGEALEAYEEVRRVDVARIQNAARNAMEWFEVVGRRYADTLEPEQFFYSMLTRSQRISHENLRLRDPAWLEGYEHWFAARSGVPAPENHRAPPPMLTPFKIRDVMLANRIVVSPMAMYSAHDGLINDFHITHLGARAMGGASLVFAEMTCVSPDARITPGCLGLLERRAAGAMEAPRRSHPFRWPRQGRHPARPRRPQGVYTACLGGHRRTLGAGQLAADLRVRIALYAAESDAARHDARRHGTCMRRFRRRDETRRGCGRRCARIALRARLSAVELSIAAHQPPRRRIRRLARGTRALSARSVSRRPLGVAQGEADFRPALVSRLGGGRQHARRRADLRQTVQGGRRRSHRLLVGSGLEG